MKSVKNRKENSVCSIGTTSTNLETEEKDLLICWAGSCKKEKMSTNDPV